jgi:hypothetical protein
VPGRDVWWWNDSAIAKGYRMSYFLLRYCEVLNVL